MQRTRPLCTALCCPQFVRNCTSVCQFLTPAPCHASQVAEVQQQTAASTSTAEPPPPASAMEVLDDTSDSGNRTGSSGIASGIRLENVSCNPSQDAMHATASQGSMTHTAGAC